jgi:hypothetical protein
MISGLAAEARALDSNIYGGCLSTDHSKAYYHFEKTMLRSLGLIGLYHWVQGKGFEPSTADDTDLTHLTDLVRSSVVLGVSAMDAYFTNRFVEMLIPYIKRRGPTRAMVKLLHDAGLNAEQALIMAAMDRPFSRVRTIMTRHLERTVTQKFSAIDNLFTAFGLNDFCANVQGKSGRKRLLRSIEILVQRRHEIVHEGDLNAKGVLQPIGAKEVLFRLRHLNQFVTCADVILNGMLQSRRRQRQPAIPSLAAVPVA